ncbi:hypothetical protein M408DRAFT_333887 [Serendipita vermifera MAFF 305830]|uniref:Uncharacterized protein n=1 Tax=Serendipita vermifera MAFF 305830 TaxID=933852 RepID=A0A0C3AN02_SERVB|nr:hypothetical protein M408DRAFT_333887 [Serendipita vermifera MAFF 305830]
MGDTTKSAAFFSSCRTSFCSRVVDRCGSWPSGLVSAGSGRVLTGLCLGDGE